MHLLYLDDSGSVHNAADNHFILAGLSVHERHPYFLSRRLDRIAQDVWPDNPAGIEFRGNEMFSGRRHWRGVRKEHRLEAYVSALGAIRETSGVRLFGAAIHKAAISPNDPVDYAFEQLCNRFDRMLGRMHKAGNGQKGLIVLDKASYETSLQKLAVQFRSEGHRWGQLYNISEVPLFVDSRATRLIQLADLVAYAIRRYYVNGESQYFDRISRSFDAEGGVVHGLVHYTP